MDYKINAMARRDFGMVDRIRKRIIGDSPPHLGGKVAYSLVMPWHEGGCVLRYSFGGADKHARFPNYGVARTAAIRAIFCQNRELDGICISSDSGMAGIPAFQNAVDWFESFV